MFSPLSDNVLERTIGFKQPNPDPKLDPAAAFLQRQLSSKDASNLSKDLKYQFIWAKDIQNYKKTPKEVRKKINRLSGRKKKELGLHKINKRGLKYEHFIPINACWTEYMSEFLKISDLEDRGFDGAEHGSWDEVSSNLWKADMHGAFVKVVRSKCPVFVGVEGFIVFESKNMYKILSCDNITRCIPKESCEFATRINNYEFNFLGKNMIIKPNERANKKAKSFSFSCL